MARRASHSSPSRRSRNNKKNNSARILYVFVALCCVAIIGVVVWLLTRTDNYKFQRAELDKYVEISKVSNLLENGASIYVDMSDGMNYAYASQESKALLQSVINKLAANNAIKFYSLADGRISPLSMSHTELYNYMLNPNSYEKQKAPIETTLAQIIDNRQPALIMTDFEEYKGSMIEQAAYAKQYFIKWLAMGYNITFYKWNFIENGKQKLMFIAVFDDNANRLNSLVNSAVKLTDPNIEMFVLGSRDFAYPIFTQYISLKQGGNYHNSKGIDAVTAIVENGGKNDYISYAKPYATASGAPEQFAPLDVLVGAFAEYYPLGVKWEYAIKNGNQMKDNGIPQEDRFVHLFRNLFINFGAQNGFSIDNIEVRVFDMQKKMEAIYNVGDSITIEQIENVESPEINMFLTAGMQSDKTLPNGWKEIYLDFDEKFNGEFMGDIPSTNLFRANIVIAKATPEIGDAITFFSWEGNNSLADSVKETLTSSTSNPQGRVLYTYYLKTLSE